MPKAARDAEAGAQGAHERRRLLAALLLGVGALLCWLLAQPWVFRQLSDGGHQRYVLLNGLDVARDLEPRLAPAALVLACRLVLAATAAFALAGLLALLAQRTGRTAYGLLLVTVLLAFVTVAIAVDGVAEHTRSRWENAPAHLAEEARSTDTSDVGDLLVLRLSGYSAPDALRAVHYVRTYLEGTYWTARSALLLVALPVAVWAVIAAGEDPERTTPRAGP